MNQAAPVTLSLWKFKVRSAQQLKLDQLTHQYGKLFDIGFGKLAVQTAVLDEFVKAEEEPGYKPGLYYEANLEVVGVPASDPEYLKRVRFTFSEFAKRVFGLNLLHQSVEVDVRNPDPAGALGPQAWN